MSPGGASSSARRPERPGGKSICEGKLDVSCGTMSACLDLVSGVGRHSPGGAENPGGNCTVPGACSASVDFLEGRDLSARARAIWSSARSAAMRSVGESAPDKNSGSTNTQPGEDWLLQLPELQSSELLREPKAVEAQSSEQSSTSFPTLQGERRAPMQSPFNSAAPDELAHWGSAGARG